VTDNGTDAQTTPAEGEAARPGIDELTARVAELELAVRHRDQQLRMRDDRIRALRDEIRYIKGSKSAKLAGAIQQAAKIRRPREFAGAMKQQVRRVFVKQRLRRALKQ
jgi:hypothetical protein